MRYTLKSQAINILLAAIFWGLAFSSAWVGLGIFFTICCFVD